MREAGARPKLGSVLRLFIALDLDAALLDRAAALAGELRGLELPRARWVARSGMHLTVRFLGDADEALVPDLRALILDVGARHRSVAVRVDALLAFPEPRRARVLGLHIDEAGAVGEIASEIERGAVALGFAAEGRAFRAHVTLARLRAPADLRRVLSTRAVAIQGRAEALTLYQSELGQGPPTYTALARAPL